MASRRKAGGSPTGSIVPSVPTLADIDPRPDRDADFNGEDHLLVISGQAAENGDIPVCLGDRRTTVAEVALATHSDRDTLALAPVPGCTTQRADGHILGMLAGLAVWVVT